MKCILFLFAICGSSLLLSSCWDRVEVNDLAIVTAAAIDKADGNEIELSLQVFIPKSLGSSSGQQGGGGSEKGATTLIESQDGSNISDALSKLQEKIPRKIFWGQCKVFIFGEELAKEGIQRQMDFLLRHPQPRERAYVYISEGKAKSMLKPIPPLERYSADRIRKISDLHIGLQVTIQDANEMLMGISQGVALPLIYIPEPEEGDKKAKKGPAIIGTAVLKKDKMVGKLSEKTTRGILWLRNEMKSYTVTVEPEGTEGEVSLNPVSSQIQIIPRIHNEKWKVLVKITTEGALIQNGAKMTITSPIFQKAVEKAYREDIERRIESALQQTQHKMKVDVAGFGKEFHRKYPKQWKKIEKRWNEELPNVEVDYDIKAYVRKQGYITSPGGLPEKEVEKK